VGLGAFHLNGAYAISDETVTSGINTITNFLPIAAARLHRVASKLARKTINERRQ